MPLVTPTQDLPDSHEPEVHRFGPVGSFVRDIGRFVRLAHVQGTRLVDVLDRWADAAERHAAATERHAAATERLADALGARMEDTDGNADSDGRGSEGPATRR